MPPRNCKHDNKVNSWHDFRLKTKKVYSSLGGSELSQFIFNFFQFWSCVDDDLFLLFLLDVVVKVNLVTIQSITTNGQFCYERTWEDNNQINMKLQHVNLLLLSLSLRMHQENKRIFTQSCFKNLPTKDWQLFVQRKSSLDIPSFYESASSILGNQMYVNISIALWLDTLYQAVMNINVDHSTRRVIKQKQY